MKILYLIERIDSAGGIQRSLSIRANAMVTRYRHEVVIACTEKNSGIPYYDLHESIELIFLDSLSSEPSFAGRITMRFRQAKFLLGLNPDILIAVKYTLHNFFFHFLPRRAKLVSELREPKEQYNRSLKSVKSKLNAFVRDYVLSRQDLLITLTQADKRKWGFPNIQVIPNPITVQAGSRSDLQAKQVLALGRLTDVKGFDKLLEAWNIVQQKQPGWTLKICGEGELYEPLLAQANALGISESVQIPNVFANVIPEFLSSSIFVMSSQFEAFGNVLVEAKVCGLPAVAFDCPEGPREIIQNGEDGYLVPLNDIEEFAGKILLLIEDAELRQKMGDAAYRNASKFSLEEIIPRYASILDSLILEKKK